MKIERKCTVCGEKQKKDKTKSNKNWEVYSNRDVCKCGGKFGIYIDGKLIGGGC